jgi:hypothetical protein
LEKKGGDHVMAEFWPGAAYAVFVPCATLSGRIRTKALEIRRKRSIAEVSQRYYHWGKSSHHAQKGAVKLAKIHRSEAWLV